MITINKIKFLAKLTKLTIAVPLSIVGIDLLTRQIFERYKSLFELQIIRQVRRPLKIGNYRGFCPFGMVLGNSLLGPGYLDHSTIGSENLELSMVILTSLYRSRPELRIRSGKIELFLRRNKKGNYLSLSNIEKSPSINIGLYISLDQPALLKVYPVNLTAFLDLKTQVHIIKKLFNIQGRITSPSSGSVQLSSKISLKACNYGLRIISQDLNISIFSNLAKILLPKDTYGTLVGDIYFTCQLYKINVLGNLNFSNLHIPLIGANYVTGNPSLDIICTQNSIKMDTLKWKFHPWHVLLTSDLKFTQ